MCCPRLSLRPSSTARTSSRSRRRGWPQTQARSAHCANRPVHAEEPLRGAALLLRLEAAVFATRRQSLTRLLLFLLSHSAQPPCAGGAGDDVGPPVAAATTAVATSDARCA